MRRRITPSLARLRFWLSRSVGARYVDVQLAEPLVSFTFDDVPASAIEGALPILDRHGVLATFYLAAGLLESGSGFVSHRQVRQLVEARHEIGCHTYDHLRAGRSTPSRLREDTLRNARYFDDHFPGLQLSNFAYPHGSIGLWNKRFLAGRYRSLRTNQPGINAGRTDLHTLAANRLYSTLVRPPQIDGLFEQLGRLRGWLIFYTHDVCSNPSPQGCTPELFEYAVTAALASPARTVTVEQALNTILAE